MRLETKQVESDAYRLYDAVAIRPAPVADLMGKRHVRRLPRCAKLAVLHGATSWAAKWPTAEFAKCPTDRKITDLPKAHAVDTGEGGVDRFICCGRGNALRRAHESKLTCDKGHEEGCGGNRMRRQ